MSNKRLMPRNYYYLVLISSLLIAALVARSDGSLARGAMTFLVAVIGMFYVLSTRFRLASNMVPVVALFIIASIVGIILLMFGFIQ
jgi:hypothetical protein